MDRFDNPNKVINIALSSLVEFREAHRLNEEAKEQKGDSRKEAKWTKLEEGFTKLNFDAALDVINQKLGIGLIVRNSEGVILFSLCSSKPFSGLPVLAECCALWRVAELCRDLDIKDVLSEGDAKSVIQAISNCKQERSWSRELLEDIKHLFSLRSDWQALFTYRG
ncbi:hypothetical protein F2P56_014303 [Juglans regia]|uniref:RNase H type-1 domain-containing protein n=1 Tax=Juglans regia TaxID=51240 RepID=A0A834CS71_JUGRE|nr:hypothetical protein F2P56_014303 [Juglans regia]